MADTSKKKKGKVKVPLSVRIDEAEGDSVLLKRVVKLKKYGASGRRRLRSRGENIDLVVGEPCGQSSVVGHDRIQRPGVAELKGGYEVNRVECCDRWRGDALGRVEQSGVNRHQGDACQELIGRRSHAFAQAQAAKFHRHQSTRRVVLPLAQLGSD